MWGIIYIKFYLLGGGGGEFEGVWVEVGKYLNVGMGSDEDVSSPTPIFVW